MSRRRLFNHLVYGDPYVPRKQLPHRRIRVPRSRLLVSKNLLYNKGYDTYARRRSRRMFRKPY